MPLHPTVNETNSQSVNRVGKKKAGLRLDDPAFWLPLAISVSSASLGPTILHIPVNPRECILTPTQKGIIESRVTVSEWPRLERDGKAGYERRRKSDGPPKAKRKCAGRSRILQAGGGAGGKCSACSAYKRLWVVFVDPYWTRKEIKVMHVRRIRRSFCHAISD